MSIVVIGVIESFVISTGLIVWLAFRDLRNSDIEMEEHRKRLDKLREEREREQLRLNNRKSEEENERYKAIYVDGFVNTYGMPDYLKPPVTKIRKRSAAAEAIWKDKNEG